MSYVVTDFTVLTENLPSDEYAKLLHFLCHAAEFVYKKTSNRNMITCSVIGKVSVEEFTKAYRIPDTCKVMEGVPACTIRYH